MSQLVRLCPVVAPVGLDLVTIYNLPSVHREVLAVDDRTWNCLGCSTGQRLIILSAVFPLTKGSQGCRGYSFHLSRLFRGRSQR